MSIHDEGEYVWLRAEKELIAGAIREGLEEGGKRSRVMEWLRGWL
jgi:hypothetical protein